MTDDADHNLNYVKLVIITGNQEGGILSRKNSLKHTFICCDSKF